MLTRLHRQADKYRLFCADLKNTQLPLHTAIGHPNAGVQTFTLVMKMPFNNSEGLFLERDILRMYWSYTKHQFWSS